MAEPLQHSARRAQPWLGTLVEVAATAPSAAVLERALAAGFGAIARIHAMMSGHADDSELTRLNVEAARAPQPVSPELRAVLACALLLARRSQGVFDPTVGCDLAAAGFLPQRCERAGASSWRDVQLDDGGVRFLRPLMLDFDGIAKGYAVDCAIMAMRVAGATGACVNAGGDLRVWGRRSEIVHVRTGGPQGGVVPLLTLADGAVATSAYGGRRRSVRGRFATPLIDPRSRLPVMSTRTVSVVARTCMIADALTKVVALRGTRAGRLLARYHAEATIFSPAGGRWRCTRVPAPTAVDDRAAA